MKISALRGAAHALIATPLLIAIQTGLCPGAAQGSPPRHIRISILEDGGTTAGISWNTSSRPKDPVVQHGTARGIYPHRAVARVEAVSRRLGYVCQVALRGLSPGTTYHYRVQDDDGLSEEQDFTTGPPSHRFCGAFTFAFVGDSRAESWQGEQGASDIWPSMTARMLRHRPAFLLHGGDLVVNGENEGQWHNLLSINAAFSARIPLMPCLGNHDTGPGQGDRALYNRLFLLPRADKALGGNGSEDFYSFIYGNALFVSLSTESFSEGNPPFSRQAAWLDRVLSRQRALWKIVFLHRPIYTHRVYVGHRPNEVEQNRALVPVIRKHGVDLVIGSHNHFYERWDRSACVDGASTSPCPVKRDEPGTVFLTSGGGGASPIPFPGRVSGMRKAASTEPHYLIFEIRDGRLRASALTLKGTPIDRFALEKQLPASIACSPGAHASPPANPSPETPAKRSTPRPSGCSCQIASNMEMLPICFLFAPLLFRLRSRGSGG